MRSRTVLISLISVVLVGSMACAKQTLREISWAKLKAEGKITAGEVLPADAQTAFDRLKIVSTGTTPLTATILTLDNPGITSSTYAIKGQIRYEGVEGKGYLEMWNVFAGGQSYFSRTLSDFGTLKHLRGSSPWRNFELPFYITDDTEARPEQLVINVVLPGRGTVYVGPLQLVQYEPGELAAPIAGRGEAVPGEWWSPRTGALVGGIGGGGLGALIGIFGGLTAWLAVRGKARGFVLGVWKAILVFGIAALGTGLIAIGGSQPYHVWYPLMLGGGILSLLSFVLLPTIRKRFEEAELRKMSAQDTGPVVSR